MSETPDRSGELIQVLRDLKNKGRVLNIALHAFGTAAEVALMLTGITALEAALGRTFFPKRRRVAIRGNEATIKLRDCTVRFTPHTFPDNTAAIKVDGIPPWRGTNVITDQMARKFGVCTVNHHAPAAVFIAAPDPDYTFTSRRTMRIARRMRRILVHWPELLEPQSDTPSVI